jgi:molybdopterin/thiamine biosynthesis adenylyltransferase
MHSKPTHIHPLLGMHKNIYHQIFKRNIGILSFADQRKLKKSTIAIAGVGGIGGLLAERLARIGIGSLKISDPGLFEHSNINRQYGADISSINKRKSIIIAKNLKKINPEISIFHDIRGIQTQDDADLFADGASVVVDEMDYGLFKQNVFLQRAARRRNIYYIFSTALGFGGLVASFGPTGTTLEEFNGFSNNINPDTLKRVNLPLKKISPHYPSYMKGKEKIVKKTINGELAVSTNSIGVGLASILTANEVINIILEKAPVFNAPKTIYLDLMDKLFLCS